MYEGSIVNIKGIFLSIIFLQLNHKIILISNSVFLWKDCTVN